MTTKKYIIETVLCCPSCKGDLRIVDSYMVCLSCNSNYEFFNGIPILLPNKIDDETKFIKSRYESSSGEGSPNAVLPMAANMLGSVRDLTVLDIGCGRGDFERQYLLPQMPKLVIAIDFALSALQDAITKTNLGSNILFVMGDIQNLPIKSATFDRVVVTEVVEHVPDQHKAFNELSRVIKPEGEIILSTPNYFNPAGILKKIMDKFYYKGKEKWTYVNPEAFERFQTFRSIQKSLYENGLDVKEYRGSEFYLGIHQLFTFPIHTLDKFIYYILCKISLFNRKFFTLLPFKIFGVVQCYKLKKSENNIG